MQVPNHLSIFSLDEYVGAQGRDLEPIFGYLSQIEKLSEIKSPLVI